MSIQVVCQGVEAIAQNLCIGINQADVAASALTNSNVVRLRETKILITFDLPDLWESSFNHLWRTIRGSIIHDNDFCAIGSR